MNNPKEHSVFTSAPDMVQHLSVKLDQEQAANFNLAVQNNQLAVENANLKNQLNGCQSELQSTKAEIFNLHTYIAQLKSQRNENPRSFQIDTNGRVESIEPNGHHKPIGTFHYDGSIIISVGFGQAAKHLIRINYNNDAAIVPLDEIAKGNLIKYFRSFSRISSKKLANAFLYRLVMKVMNSPDIPVVQTPEYPGIYHEMENGRPMSADFMYYSGDADDVELRYLPENYVRKMLPCPQKTFSDAVKGILPYLKDKAAYLLLAYSIAGFFASLLQMIYFRLSIILIVSAPNAEAESLATCLLKTYEKEKQVLSLTMSKTAMTKTLRDTTLLWR